jgi:hypothetical protein
MPRSKHPLLTGHTRREPYSKICESGSVTEQSEANISVSKSDERKNHGHVAQRKVVWVNKIVVRP